MLVGEFERWLKEPWSIDRLAEKHTNETSFGLVYPHLYGQLDTVSGMAPMALYLSTATFEKEGAI